MFDLGFLLAFCLVGNGHHSIKALEVVEEIGKEGWYGKYDQEIHQNGVWCRGSWQGREESWVLGDYCNHLIMIRRTRMRARAAKIERH